MNFILALLRGAGGTALFLVYLTFSALYFFAIADGLAWLGLHWILAGVVAFFVAFMPFIGAICGIFGAVFAWGLAWWLAVLLFSAPFIFFIVLTALSGLVDAWHNRP